MYRNALKFRRLKVSETDVLLPFGILFTLNLTILLVWTLVDPMYWTRVPISETASYGSCSVSGNVTWKVSLSLLAVLNGAALFLANFQAYQARNLSTEYGESKYVAMAMASTLQVLLVGIPLLFLVNENPAANYFVRCTIVFVICISILTLIFIPKIYHFWKDGGALAASLVPSAQTRVTGLSFKVFEEYVDYIVLPTAMTILSVNHTFLHRRNL